MTPEQESAIADWQSAKEALAALTEKERLLRSAVAAEFFPLLHEGANPPIELGDGWRLRATGKVNRTLKQFDETFRWPQWLGAAAFADLFPEKRSLSESAWKKLSTIQKADFADWVTEKIGTPTIEIVPPPLGG